MKTLLAALVSSLLSLSALAADDACLTEAAGKKLSGAARSSFVHKCVRERCEAGAVGRQLAGAARNSFMTRCLADGLEPYCAEQAASKKLAGAAKASFMKKCQSGK